MFIYFVILNVYFRIFLFLINPNNLWHWRIPVQGILQEIVAAGVFYLCFKGLFLIIRSTILRQIIFLIFVLSWTSLNFINYEYADTFNKLLPLSWFFEVSNVGAMGSLVEVTKDYMNRDLALRFILPIVLSFLLIFKFPDFLFKIRKFRHIIYVFLISSVCQSATLDPGIQPMWDNIVHSHLLKYWYYSYDDQSFPQDHQAVLPEFSEMFKQVVLEKADPDTLLIPPVKAAKPNVVLLMLESFRSFETGAFGSTLGLSPNFDRYAQEGILFTRIYAGATLTKQGQWSLLCGSHYHRGTPVLTHFRDHTAVCLPDLLYQKGYDTWWFHGQSAAYDFQGYFLKRHSVKQIMDRLTFPITTEAVGWGLSDQALVEHTLDHLPEAQEPFFWIVQTQTNHHPYVVPPRFDKNRGYPESINKFLNTFFYTDYALGLFLDRYLKTPQGKNSLIIITADHGTSKDLPDVDRQNEEPLLSKYHIPLLILYPEDERPTPQKIEVLGGQPDVMPTIMDLLQIPESSPLFGRSLIKKHRHRFAKGLHPSHWLLTNEKLFITHPGQTTWNLKGKRITPEPEDRSWRNLSEEIDQIQDWMIRQTDPNKMNRELAEKGWKMHSQPAQKINH